MLRVLDLFSGIGGFTLGLQMAGGFKTVAFAEVAPYPSSVLSRNYPGVPNLGDVTKLCRRLYDCEGDEDYAYCSRCDDEFGDCACIGTDQFLDEYGGVDVVTGGVPCQPASIIGKRRGTEDERWLWPDTLRILRELRPRYGIFENPAGILTLESGRAFSGILGGLAALRYDAWWECVLAAAVGAGHRRERVFILVADANRARLEGYAGDGQASGRPESRGSITAPNLLNRKFTERRWYAQSGIRPVVDGLSSKLVRSQLEAIGNSVVPQCVKILGEAIQSYEFKKAA